MHARNYRSQVFSEIGEAVSDLAKESASLDCVDMPKERLELSKKLRNPFQYKFLEDDKQYEAFYLEFYFIVPECIKERA